MTSADSSAPAEGAAERVRRFLATYYAGNVAEARAMLTPDFTFRAPLVDRGTQEVFFDGAEEKLALISGFRVLRQWADGDDVSTLYEIEVTTDGRTASMPMHEWHHVRAGSIESTDMLFDTVAPAAELIRHALTSDHARH